MNISSSPPNQEAMRIVIADTYRLFAEACKTLLQPEFKVIAIVTDGAEIPEVVARVSPELIVADAEMPRIRPFGCWKNLQGESSQFPKLVILTSRFGTETAIGEFRKGASAVVSKQCGTQELLRAVQISGAWRVLRVRGDHADFSRVASQAGE